MAGLGKGVAIGSGRCGLADELVEMRCIARDGEIMCCADARGQARQEEGLTFSGYPGRQPMLGKIY